MKRIIEIALSDAEEGMQLANDVVDAKGVCLLAGGTALSLASINVLQRRGIETVSTYQLELLTDEQRQKKRQEIEQQLDHCFSKVIEEPFMESLKQIFMDYRCKDL